MKFYELKISAFLNSRIHFQKAPEIVSKAISTHLIKNGFKFHNSQKFKNYVFSNFFDGKDGYYDGEKSFLFRTFDEKIADVMMKFFKYADKILKGGSVEIKEVRFSKIPALKTLNPVVVTVKNNIYWTYKNGDIMLLLDRLHKNLVKKYEFLFGEKLETDSNFIEYINFINDKPQSLYYKNRRFFGNKFLIIPRDDEISQKLSFIAIGMGLGEKNSLVGAGFLQKLKKAPEIDFG